LNENKENKSKENIDFNSFLAANLQKSLYLKEDLLRQAFDTFDDQRKG